MIKKMKFTISGFIIVLLFNSCGNSSECINWEEYHEEYFEDFEDDDLDFSVHSNIEDIMYNAKGEEEVIDGLSFKLISRIELPSVINSAFPNPEDIVYDADFKYILRKDGDLFTGCIVDGGSHYKFENGLLVLWEEYLFTWGESPEIPIVTDTLLHKMQFKNGLPNGKWFTKHVNENRDYSIESIEPEAEGEFLNGNRHGKWKWYNIYKYELEKTVEYDNGKINGEFTYIDYQSSTSTVLTTKRYYQNGLVTEKKWGNWVKDERAKKYTDENGNVGQVLNDSLYLNEVKVYEWNPNWFYDYGYHIQSNTWEALGFDGGTWKVLAHLYQYARKGDDGADDSTLIYKTFPAGEIITREKYFADHTNYDREYLSKMVDPELLYLEK